MYTMQGKYLWIWEVTQTLGGDVQAIANLGKTLGLTGFLIKAHDGAAIWPQFASVCAMLQKEGFAVLAWGYGYGEDPEAEANAAHAAIQAGAQAYVIDAEDGYEGKPEAAVTFGTALRSKNPSTALGYAPFAFPSEHPTFPYQQFSAFCQICLPQLYWADFSLSVTVALARSYQELAPFGLPIVPVGQAFGTASSEQIRLFGKLAKERNASAICFWDAQSANSRQLRAISSIQAYPSPVPMSNSTSSTLSASDDSTGMPTESSSTREEVSALTPDVQPGHWYFEAIHDLLRLEVITAYQDGLFKPDQVITRAQASDWLNRLRLYIEARGKFK